MELFSIHCTTCRARLVVKDEAVIGDILACPKCGSMVQIVPPPGWSRAEAGTGTSAGNESVAAGPLSASTSLPKPEAVPPALPPRKPVVAHAPPAVLAAAAPLPVVGDQPIAPPAPADAASGKILASATSRTIAGLHWPLVAIGVGTGVAIGTLAWLAVWLQTAPAPVVANAEPPAAVSQEQEWVPREVAVENALDSTPLNMRTVAVEPAPAAAPAGVQNAPAERTDARAGEPETAHAAAAQVEPSADTPQRGAPGTPALKLEPVEANRQAVGMDDAAEDDSARSAADPMSAADIDMAQDAVPYDAADVPASGTLDDEFIDRGSPGEPAVLATEQIEARLRVPLARVEFSGVPLAQFAMFISDVTGVPVLIDDVSLAAAGKSRKSPIDVRLAKTTAMDALQAASRSAALSFSIENGRVRIHAAQP